MGDKSSLDCKEDRLTACPDCAQEKLRKLEPGDCLTLLPGRYTKPLTAVGLRGLAGSTITIKGATPKDKWWKVQNSQRLPDEDQDTLFTSCVTADDYKTKANEAAARKQAAGSFPGLYYLADEAQLYLRDCQHVTIKGLYFDKCWPTALYIDNCQDIVVRACQFRWGTFAIGATGQHTRHILVEKCRWRQNPDNQESGKPAGHWKKIAWQRIHGDISNSGVPPDYGVVNIEDDYRHFDGDFFAAWRIAGFVTLRKNLIEDAFNAIHLFNFEDTPSPLLNLNVVIEKNRFERIRDNAIEPEGGAWNWIVRHNELVDVYSWFSFEMKRSGWFYIYGNVGWHTQSPGPGKKPPEGIDPDARRGGAIFKLTSRHAADGPTYFFHNSFHLRERIAKQKRFAGLRFFNNAIVFCQNAQGECSETESLFAKDLKSRDTPHSRYDKEGDIIAAEKNRFTKDWEKLGIAFYSNVIYGADRLHDLRSAGYPFGENSRDGYPGFKGPLTAEATTAESFQLKCDTDGADDATEASIGFTLETKGWRTFEEQGCRNIGAYQEDGSLFALEEEFGWLEHKPGTAD
ncbi:right-handed parallel beta-helix repeat-containing protein [Hoeflea poritis]|uniref:Right-handed parallel beta-helix repeat-containing protein n=1 Tax=Hoeflea poritis TaxID=2993659 RepID=A0ABT4VU17_9HYPH|nr:right-handed parallel beta-helix repeat-containing protein [Hoeflea poritis]MDA4847478.1 right-handed parallel beta-helix repeat-containing protein [Hoeflea poritis]